MATEHQSPAAICALLSMEMAIAVSMLLRSGPGEVQEDCVEVDYLAAQFGTRLREWLNSYFLIT